MKRVVLCAATFALACTGGGGGGNGGGGGSAQSGGDSGGGAGGDTTDSGGNTNLTGGSTGSGGSVDSGGTKQGGGAGNGGVGAGGASNGGAGGVGTGGMKSGGAGGGNGGASGSGGAVNGTPGQWTRLLNWPLDTKLISGEGVLVDPVRPSDFYFFYETGRPNAGGDRHVLKTTDFGTTWNQIEKTASKGNAWGVAIDPNPLRDPKTPPTMYTPAGYGDGGVWKSIDGGVTWTSLIPASGVVPKPGGGTVTFPPDKNGGHNDFYQIHILPDNPPNHILVTYHYGTASLQALGESKDGGTTWEVHNVPWGDSHYAYGVDANTWILVAGRGGPALGTYRTTTAGRVNGVISEAAWTKVSDFTHQHGSFTPFIDKKNNVLYFPGENDFPVQGIRRSSDGGATWVSIYDKSPVGMLLGTPTHLYGAWLSGNQILTGAVSDTPNFKSSAPNGFTGSVPPYGAATSFDGQRWVLIVAQYHGTANGELWRYIEP